VSSREYLNAEQLAVVTPWSPDAIRRMVTRGTFQKGVHYFQPLGPRTQMLFKWRAIVALIEAGTPAPLPPPPTGDGEGPDVEAVTAALERVLDRTSPTRRPAPTAVARRRA
jgi:hypothetical protein